MFEDIVGHEAVKNYLRKALKEEKLPSALLFVGPDGVGKSLFAKEVAAFLLKAPKNRIDRGNHPDFHTLSPEGKGGLFAIETLREMIEAVHRAPFEAPRKVFVLHDADRMQPAAANALLKTLEEPNLDTTILLIASSTREILPTILSRCAKVSFLPLKEGEVEQILKKLGDSEAGGSFKGGLKGKEKPLYAARLFALLSHPYPYYQLAFEVDLLEKELSSEDPVERLRNVEEMFSLILAWGRDQKARELGFSDRLLLKEAPAASYPIPPLEVIEEKIEEAKEALARNIKLSSILMQIFQEV